MPSSPEDGKLESGGCGSDENGQLCGSSLFLKLPEDVLALISAYLFPRDLFNLSLSSRSLYSVVSSSEKIWLSQCRRAGLPAPLLPRWRSGVRSHRALCRFLSAVSPLLGLWVHQNPELGNVVFVLWGFLSVVGCRVIPQELGPLGLSAGPLLWTPVFEIIADADGSPETFFLHGREADDSLYPGLVSFIRPDCNVLLLEVDNRDCLPCYFTAGENQRAKLLYLSNTTVSSALPTGPFSRLAFGDRRRLLDLVAGRVRLKVPRDLLTAPLFPPCASSSSIDDEVALLEERRLVLIKMHKLSGGRVDWRGDELQSGGSDFYNKTLDGDGLSPLPTVSSASRKWNNFFSVAGYFRDGLRQFIGKPKTSQMPSVLKNGASGASTETKHVQLHEFLRGGDTIGLSLCATKMRLTTYRAWPNMHDNRFALYKLPLQLPVEGQEYAGLWGGTFGWPPGQSSEDKPGKALFFLLLSYEEIDGHLILIATKILEGTHYVLHPNGSAMFIVKVEEPSPDPFPWETYVDSIPVEVKRTYSGEGIANGYGFRYPGSKPGSLFEIQNGHLAFVWKESKSVLTMQRLELEDLLKKGERVPSLPRIANFAYLTKSYSNVFAGFPNSSSCSSPPRFN
ncbi:F-box protein At5g39450 [Phalaenopsis equestris]|uniref:F-box protein At5g39450 n=1 Tax=Phalaenopsis equestris TaxID=78828 RepID=UPI0009E415B2|nr:F-box protein At5g39450 [Phalaenopsis equestris]